jgi:hypothetical protein
MKRLFLTLVAIAAASVSAYSQTAVFGNEWIDYSPNVKYYKIPTHSNAMYRISKSFLDSIGLPTSALGSELQLWHEGNQVAMYITTASNLGSTDYIDFFGKRATGKMDAEVYDNKAQMDPFLNLLNDTTYFFLVYKPGSSNNLRYVPTANTISSPPAKELYCIDTLHIPYRTVYSKGRLYYTNNTNFTSSRFEQGEGYLKRIATNSADSINLSLDSCYKVAGAPDIKINSFISGQSLGTHTSRLTVNGFAFGDSTFFNYEFERLNLTVPVANIASNNIARLKFTAIANVSDAQGFTYVGASYPKKFTFGNKTYEYFEMPAKSAVHYIEITGFNVGGVAPSLFDLTNNKVYSGDISTAGVVKFQLPATSSQTQYALISGTSTQRINVNKGNPVSFINYETSSTQGDVLMLYSNRIYNTGGTDYIREYKDYRESASGGSHTVATIPTEQLYDQFGWGYNFHSAGLQRFFKFLKLKWTTVPPKYLILCGKGIDYRTYNNSSATMSLLPYNNMVPGFGLPGSDNMLADYTRDGVPDLLVGRISAYNMNDVGAYLNKVKEYELRQISPIYNAIDSNVWKKNVLHIAGGSTEAESAGFTTALVNTENVLKLNKYGAKTYTIAKGSTNPIQNINNAVVDSMINAGLGLIQYYGHSTPDVFAYALNDPTNYTNSNGKYNFILANGCDAGDLFYASYDKCLTEKFITAPSVGSVAFIGSVASGYTGYLDNYTMRLYGQFVNNLDTAGIGEQMRNVISSARYSLDSSDDRLRLHMEHIQLNGDPMVKFLDFPKADYALEEKYVSINNGASINTSMDSFTVNIKLFNLKRYLNESVDLRITRGVNNITQQTFTKTYAQGIAFDSSYSFTFPIDKVLSKGLNNIEIKIDALNASDESNELNNTLTYNVPIYDEDMTPIWPYNFSILDTNDITLVASTYQNTAPSRQYIIQIDTTILFNSPLLQSTKITTSGGSISWKPNLTMQDSTVYYWRTAKDTLYGNSQFNWSQFSFVYLPGAGKGWNQSHYYQYKTNTEASLKLNANRIFTYDSVAKKIIVNITVQGNPLPYAYNYTDFRVNEDNFTAYTTTCFPLTTKIHVLLVDPKTGLLMENPVVTLPNIGKWGSGACPAGATRESNKFFEFSYSDTAWRGRLTRFFDSIPNGYHVAVFPHLRNGNKYFVDSIAKDTLLPQYAAGGSLYAKFKSLGFTYIDSFNKNRPWLFWFKKGAPASETVQYIEKDSTKILANSRTLMTPSTQGYFETKPIGPAKEWQSIIKSVYALDAPTDKSNIALYGIDSSGAKILLTTLYGTDTNISFINAQQYPYLIVRYNSEDTVEHSAEQLKYWRILYKPLVDLAVVPNVALTFDTLMPQGRPNVVNFAVQNLTGLVTDSTIVKVQTRDVANNLVQTQNIKLNSLKPFEKVTLSSEISTAEIPGKNMFQINVNPNKIFNEQTFVNNSYENSFTVGNDKINPLLDVTFDGVHISNGDIVSAKPHIMAKIKDNSQYLKLNDTAQIECYLQRPNELNEHRVYFNDTLTFEPAKSAISAENAAFVHFKPNLLEDGIYTFSINAKDKSGNAAGQQRYSISFKIINQQMVSNMLNYPNPFSTSTRFVFTLTGSEIPDNLKVQIMSSTGRVVREVTRAELGVLRIGRNVSEFVWDGTDQLGDKLANGVYFYRLISSHKGKSIVKYTNADVDKYFDNNIGKMVIMR